jgi:hypothetical protein
MPASSWILGVLIREKAMLRQLGGKSRERKGSIIRHQTGPRPFVPLEANPEVGTDSSTCRI